MKKIRVLVVDDSLTMRKGLVTFLNQSASCEVVGEAPNGQRAIELCLSLRPDIITMDMIMPKMNGLEATEYIMAHCPTPILIVSASLNRSEVFKTYEALAAGALDAIDKPNPNETPTNEWYNNLLSAIQMLYKIKVITHIHGKNKDYKIKIKEAKNSNTTTRPCIAIGTSTGGPAALLSIFGKLPVDFSIPIFLVIHISPAFGDFFADWLSSNITLPARFARHQEPVMDTPGIIIAPPDFHLTIEKNKLNLNRNPEVNHCRPSIDVFFDSLARERGSSSVGILLTGMGRDGAEGLLSLKKSGAVTVAQDESSCVIFGMPHEAINISAAQRILSLNEISTFLLSLETKHEEICV